ncbi:hypothetical protein ACIQNU_09400 [Streptomyces sp. NPDC091292]|uniref:hypothetical protein n=1 Tax=Streptomyces sp. NPDC091292 TaxID=3365991 RepID=UPI0037F9ABAC
MAHTFEELVEKQQVANEAHAKVLALRDTHGAPTHGSGWSETQTTTYETAWRAWRDLARDVQSAVTEFAREQGVPRSDVEADVKARAQPPGPEDDTTDTTDTPDADGDPEG